MNGTSVSTLYWAQSLVIRAGAEFGPSPLVQLMPGATLAGYAVGVALLAAIARDLTSPTGLVLHVIVLTAALCIAAAAPSPVIAASACLLIGVGCSLTQRLLASATSMVAPEARAETIGWIIASGLFGIVLARALVPIAAAWFGWRTMFWGDAVLVALVGLAVIAGSRLAETGVQAAHHPKLPAAIVLWWAEPTLRHAAIQQGAVFATFNLGWALYPRLLTASGVAPILPMGIVASLGATAAVLAGQICRRKDPADIAAAGLVTSVLAITILLVCGGSFRLYVVAMALLDMSTQVSLVANQARAQALATSPAMRGRVTAMVTTVGFAGGALGAALGNLLH
jgi:predicted MFS family arabinose efflux permease